MTNTGDHENPWIAAWRESNIPPVSIVLLICGLFLFVLGISSNGIDFFGVRCPAPSESYRGSSILFGAVLIIVSITWMINKARSKQNTSQTDQKRSDIGTEPAKELEREVVKFLMDIFEGNLDPEIQEMADDALIERNRKGGQLIPCFLCSLVQSTYLGNQLRQATIFELIDNSELVVCFSWPPLAQSIIDSLQQDTSGYLLTDDAKPFGLAARAYKAGQSIKVYYDKTYDRAFLLERAGELGINEELPDFIPLKGVDKSAVYGSTVATPFRLRLNQKDYVLCLDSELRETFTANGTDAKLEKVTRYVSIALEVQLFFQHLYKQPALG